MADYTKYIPDKIPTKLNRVKKIACFFDFRKWQNKILFAVVILFAQLIAVALLLLLAKR